MKPLDSRGEEIPASQILPVDPPEPHDATDCPADCWVCAWRAAMRAEFGGGERWL